MEVWIILSSYFTHFVTPIPVIVAADPKSGQVNVIL